MWKGIILLQMLICSVLCVNAVPALKKYVKKTQSDGTVICLKLCGDEYVHYFSTIDDIPVFETQQGYCYGYVDNDSLCISDIITHNVGERSNQEISFIKKHNSNVIEYLKRGRKVASKVANSRRTNSKAARVLGQQQSYIGKKKGLVILVNFANLTMSSDNAQHIFYRLFNEVGYSDNGSIGSVHDYFHDQSYGKFDLTFDVVGPVMLSKNYGYYGGNSELYGDDRYAREMVVEACEAVDETVNFKDYDWDGDGEVDQVFIIYAGYGEHAGAPSNTIWPHESALSNMSIMLDGVKIDTYACSCELVGTRGNTVTGIGTPCHEFSHCLGFPDLYDTDYSGAFGMSAWDIMSSGSHSGPTNNGEIPYGYSAYERWFAGWLEPMELTYTQQVESLKNVGDTPHAYIIYNERNRNEYYILENHQADKWFKYVGRYTGMHGLMITHVDYDEKAWATNKVNPTPMHQRMNIIPADNSFGTTEDDFMGDLFPGGLNVTWLTNESHASSGGKLFNRNTDGTYNMNRAIGNITENEDGIISFDVIFNNDVPAPIISDATEITQESYIANWEPVYGADYYIIEQTSIDFTNIIFPVRKTETVNSVYGTSQQMKWLTQKGKTNYHVRSVVNGIMSEWSDNKSVEYIPETGIVDLKEINKDNVKYYGINGVANKRMRHGVNIIQSGGHTSKLYMK